MKSLREEIYFAIALKVAQNELPISYSTIYSYLHESQTAECGNKDSLIIPVITAIAAAPPFYLVQGGEGRLSFWNRPGATVNTNVESPPPELIILEPGQNMPLPKRIASRPRPKGDAEETLLKD